MALGMNLHPVVNDLVLEDLKKLEKVLTALPSMINDVLDDCGLPTLGPGESVWTKDVLPLVQRRIRQIQRTPRRHSNGNVFQKVKEAVPIEDFAGRFTELKSAGANMMKGLCPLHTERTPSFVVYPGTDTWRCYGACAEGGDVVTLARRLMDRGVL